MNGKMVILLENSPEVWIGIWLAALALTFNAV